MVHYGDLYVLGLSLLMKVPLELLNVFDGDLSKMIGKRDG